MRISASLAALLILAGCAAFDAADCGPDWYSIGQRDGRIGAQPQDASYAARCGAEVDAARYGEGWQHGFRSRPHPAV